MTFAEISIPAAKTPNPAEREAEERTFLAWREGEMRLRFEAKDYPGLGTRKVTAAPPAATK